MNDKAVHSYFRTIDTLWQAGLSRFTLGISPAGFSGAFYAWTSHLAQSPGKVMEIASYPILNTQKLLHRMTCKRSDKCLTDPRFKSEHWDKWPWRLYAETFLQAEEWWKVATTNVPGLHEKAERTVSFTTRQLLDSLCPANFPLTNPDLALATFTSGGQNLVKGATHAWEDTMNMLTDQSEPDPKFRVGENIAVTPGKIVFRNNLIELIRYTPRTGTVYKEPVLIIPAWIMKYYILDLSPHNSLVRWLVEQGHSVYMISWKNPTWEDRHLGMDDYYHQGAMTAIDQVTHDFPGEKIHLTGYCLGGTLALITAAAMAERHDDRLKTLTLFAAQGDFTEAGELETFVTQSEVTFLKNMMDVQGYLDTKQMAGAFQMLRPYDLIWSKMVNDYMEGKRRDTYDLTAWNADATRMPSRMHGEYLEKLFLHNDFAEGRFKVEGKPVSSEDIRIPVFSVSTEKDHVAPWRSVYKIHWMVRGDVTFALTAGGHNAGIISEPGHVDRSYRIHERKRADSYIDADTWRAQRKETKGSWWEAWGEWLQRHSQEERMTPPPFAHNLEAAPGAYVLQR